MNKQRLHVLMLRETDVDGAVNRCCGSEELYSSCLQAFLEDRTMSELTEAISKGEWDKAFTSAHALKGLAGNMGFVPLMHMTGQLVVLIRGGRMREIKAKLDEVNSCYRDITDGIRQFFALPEQDETKNQA